MISKDMSKLNRPHVVIGLLMIAASGAAVALTPTRHLMAEGVVNLEKTIPHEFAGWRQVQTPVIQMDLTPRDGELTTTDKPYDQTLMRTYIRPDGNAVMLALAWSRSQRQEVKIHRPELCYVAQGFEVKDKHATNLNLGSAGNVTAYRLMTRNDQRMEPITYWIRIGDKISLSALQSRLMIFKEGLKGRVPDGILVRVSQAAPPGQNPAPHYQVEEQFLRDLIGSLDAPGRELLRGKL